MNFYRNFLWAARQILEHTVYFILCLCAPTYLFMAIVHLALSAFGTNHGILLFFACAAGFQLCYCIKKFLDGLCEFWFDINRFSNYE